MSMWLALAIVAALAVGGAFVVAARRRSVLFVLGVRGGKLVVLRGDPPGTLVGDLEEILPQASASGGVSIRASRGAGGAELIVRGVDPATEQRLRNVFGTYPISKLRR
jgi:hypothetical protein